MEIGKLTRALLLSICLIASNTAKADMADFYSEPGSNPNRSLSSSSDFDAIDPFSGKLRLQHTDIFIPGNGGLDLEVVRSYTSGNVWNGQYGYSGWSMDFGYVEVADPTTLCISKVYGSTSSANPILVTQDGSQQVLFGVSATVGMPQWTFLYITKNFWKASCEAAGNGLVVTSPDGKTYDMTYLSSYGTGVVGQSRTRYYVTKITDRNGNYINITYLASQTNGALISTVTTSDGRQLSYSYTAADATGNVQLASITDGTRTWTYSYIVGSTVGLSVGTYLLSSVTLPDSTTWVYTYNYSLGTAASPTGTLGALIPGSYQVSQVKTPQGGLVNYTYGWSVFNNSVGLGYLGDFVVTSKKVTGGATWNYSYTPSSGVGVLDMTSVSIVDPVSAPRTDTYSHYGYNTILPTGELWKVGLLVTKTIGTKQREDYSWGWQTISDQQWNIRSFPWTVKQDGGLFLPKLLSKTITRDGGTYSTTYPSIDFFGNAWGATEVGPTGLNRAKTFNFSVVSYYDPKWILHQQTYEWYNGLNHSKILDANNNVLFDTQGAAITTAYTYNTDGTVATMTPPGGAIYAYSSIGVPTPSGTQYPTAYGTYFRGIPLSEQQQDGVSISRAVSNAGVVTSETNGNGNTTGYTYDGLNRLTSVTRPINNQVTITYSSNPYTKLATRGSLTETTLYDGFGRPTSVNLGGNTTTYQYDGLGRMTFKSNPNSTAGTNYTYDDLGRVSTVKYADGSSKTYGYGAISRTVTDENGNKTTYNFYAYGDPDKTYVTSIVPQDATATITIARDALDHPTLVTQGTVTRNYLYNGLGALLAEGDPELGATAPNLWTTAYTYDSAMNVAQRNSSGVLTNYTYDFHNRLVGVNNNAGMESTTNTYSKTGKILSSAFSGSLYSYPPGALTNSLAPSTRTFTYDANDNLVSDSLLVSDFMFSWATTYAYDGNDKISSVTYPISGQVVAFSPDVLGRPTAVSGYVSAASYWPSGQVNQITYQNGTTSSYGQNARLWPSSFSTQSTAAGSLINSTYAYDLTGNLTSIADATTPVFNRTFGYDSLNRLTTITASGSWGTGSISYDSVGNITSQTFGTSGMAYTYFSNNQLASVTGALRNTTYGYDIFGDVLTDGTGKIYTYDYKPTLIGVYNSNTSAAITYSYDGLNSRIRVLKNGIYTYEFSDQSGKLLAEYVPSQKQLTEYMYLGGMRVAQRVSYH